jgi:hypothetical protein
MPLLNMTPAQLLAGDGQFLVTIRIERGDGRASTAALLLPGNLLAAAAEDQEQAADKMVAAFTLTYQQVSELPR